MKENETESWNVLNKFKMLLRTSAVSDIISKKKKNRKPLSASLLLTVEREKIEY